MLFRFLVIPLSLILLCGFSCSTHAASILIWGDSLSAGYGLQPAEAWPALLQEKVRKQGFDYHVVNGSISGETSAGGRSRLPAALNEHKPDILVIELGANDGLRGLRPQQMAENLSAMVDMAKQKKIRVLLIGMEMPPNYGLAYTRNFKQAFRDVAEQNDISLLPFLLEGFAEKRDMFQDDGIHPIAETQTIILEHIWKPLMPLLEKQTPMHIPLQ